MLRYILQRPPSRTAPRIARTYHASILPSLISTSSPEFVAKSSAMDELVADLERKTADARLGGGEKAADRMRSKGKKLPRERYMFTRRRSARSLIVAAQTESSPGPEFTVSRAISTGCT